MSKQSNRVENINDIELAALKRDRERMATLRAELGALAIDVHDRERDIIRRIEAGAKVDGAVVLTRRRQSVSWLSVVAEELGAETIERIKNVWPISFWKELQIV